MKVTLGSFEATPLVRSQIAEVLDSGRLSYGPKCVAFEKAFAKLHGCDFGVLSNSGTSSLVVAIQTLKELRGWRDGDEIIAPAQTFVATINAILHNRLTPVLVDVESRYYNMDPLKVRAAVTPFTRALLPVHLFGQPADMMPIKEIAWEHDLSIVEDSCETVMATTDRRVVGSWGDIACFSTYTAHHIVTGIGGVCTTNNPVLASHMRSLVNHGLAVDNMPSGKDYDPSFLGRNFVFDKIGHSFRVTELEAALGLAQLDTLGEQIFWRQHNAEHLYRELLPLSDVLQLPAIRHNATHTYMVFPIVLYNEPKDNLKAYLRDAGVEVRDMVPLTNQPCYRDLFEPSLYPVSNWLNKCGLYVGCHKGLNIGHMNYIADTIKAYFAGK